jgi:adenine-specific DNA methylase
MLLNGLGHLLHHRVPNHKRFFDLFCGTGSVASFVASKCDIPVVAGDLQLFAVTLAGAHVERTSTFDAQELFETWLKAAADWKERNLDVWRRAEELAPVDGSNDEWKRAVIRARHFCGELNDDTPLTRAYGGYYFSPIQSLTLDALRASLPCENRTAALAALISAASSCAASPGHTAQPFGYTPGGLPHLASAWNKDLSVAVVTRLHRIASTWAKKAGAAVAGDAAHLALEMEEGDLAFIDPPYSDVQYSRFYHVLEGIARGYTGESRGTGRYPPLTDRPQSKFSRVGEAKQAFDELMLCVASTGARAIVTFPSEVASNGLSGELVEAISDQYFSVRSKKISSVFSTLGGNAVVRRARKHATELIMYLEPR